MGPGSQCYIAKKMTDGVFECRRSRGHTGPCAAYQVRDDTPRAKIVHEECVGAYRFALGVAVFLVAFGLGTALGLVLGCP